MRRTINKALRVFGYEIQKTRFYQADAFQLQRQMLPVEQAVIFDVGAHVGSVAKIYRALYPAAEIHCFEPFPQSFEQLQQRTRRDAKMHCHPLAVSDRKGTAVLHANATSPTNSLLPTDERGRMYWGEGVLETRATHEVRTTTIDDFVREHSIEHIHILKLDVQGAEFNVLAGTKEALDSQRVSLIYTELILCPTYEGQKTLSEYLNLLESYEYRFLDFFNPIRRRQQMIQADVVFVSSKFYSQHETTFLPSAAARRKAS